MSGHSKWANIQHRKGRQDEKRGKVSPRRLRKLSLLLRAAATLRAMLVCALPLRLPRL